MEFIKKYKGWIIFGVIALFAILVVNWWMGVENKAVELEEIVQQKWSDVESNYQRRSDLIPNLVNTVKGYAEHEKEVLTAVTEARAKASSIQVDPTKLTPEMINQFQSAQGELSSALGRLLVTVEKYPDLKANQNFLELQAQLEGTENRINVARQRFNEAVKNFNTHIKKVPNKWVLSYEPLSGFKSKEGADVAPDVEF